MFVSKRRLAKFTKRLLQIDMALARGGVENAERSHHHEPFRPGRCYTGPVIHEDCVSLKRSGETNRCSFPRVKSMQDLVCN